MDLTYAVIIATKGMYDPINQGEVENSIEYLRKHYNAEFIERFNKFLASLCYCQFLTFAEEYDTIVGDPVEHAYFSEEYLKICTCGERSFAIDSARS